ncbi:MAG: alanine--tRNA ligase, partial [Acidimicrobiia bacterium]|nr:alanine--tRNA ligase [Acidimicrobiia bacterium]
MDANSIRREFLSFFEQRDHTVVPSSSLIPVDPTLLLTNAGMVQFKPYFLGDEEPPYKRATTAQKAFRTEDIDIIGTTASHFTFFEMLGNFSFGDYFKEKAIPWSYEFVTEVLGMDPQVLWFTVHETDDEAEEIWIDGVGVAPERVQRGGQDNFWQMGVAGPCGPSSELFVDLGPERGQEGGPIGGSESRYVEIWNLVFMQNIQDEPYHVIGDLPARNIDTGMGLERVAMVMQNAGSAFETDAVRPVLTAAERGTGTRYHDSEQTDVGLRILADHGRALSLLIGDGVVPSNQGRGYVLRRILRRAVRIAYSMGSTAAITPSLVDATIEIMGSARPELVTQRDFIAELAEREEWGFRRTLEAGSSLLDAELGSLAGEDHLSGDVAFKLHDTFGFPIELTSEIVAERGLSVDIAAFESLMEQQRTRARAAWKGGDASDEAGEYRHLLDDVGPSEFVGYELEATPGRVLSMLREGTAVAVAEKGQSVEVFLDRTPFYAEAGGQVGDTGSIVTATGTMRVTDTKGPLPGLNGHLGKVIKGTIEVGQDAEATIDSGRRELIRKSHTGTHVLHWALRDVLGAHVQQAGSLVEDGRFRFDFSHFAAPTPDEIAEVERRANDRIFENARVNAFETSKKEAEELGALAFFGDKYGDRVRVVEVGDFSRELCGGTHVRSSGQIGPVVVVSEGSIGSNMRRVEAFTGSVAYERLAQWRRQLEGVAASLGAPTDDAVDAVAALARRSKEQEARLASFEDSSRASTAASLVEGAADVAGFRLVIASVPNLAPDDLRSLTMAVRDRLDGGVAVLGSEFEGKAGLVAAVAPQLRERGLAAGDLIADAATALGGGGSRDPDLAQAGGPKGGQLEEALAMV